MKLTHTQNMKRKSGMTLLELTVVILVLLSLIAILFVGARAWKKGSDRSANIMNIRNVQQAVRGHQNMHGLKGGGLDTAGDAVAGDPLGKDTIVGDTGYLKEPNEPNSEISYEYGTSVPAVGELYLQATYTDETPPNETTGAAGVASAYAPDADLIADW